MSFIFSVTGMSPRIHVPCGLTLGYTLMPGFIFGWHLSCALQPHVRVQAEASPYCGRPVLMSVRIYGTPSRQKLSEAHERLIPMKILYIWPWVIQPGPDSSGTDSPCDWKSFVKSSLSIIPQCCLSGGLRSDRTKRMISAFCPANKAFAGRTVESTGGNTSANNLDSVIWRNGEIYQPAACHQQRSSLVVIVDIDVGTEWQKPVNKMDLNNVSTKVHTYFNTYIFNT